MMNNALASVSTGAVAAFIATPTDVIYNLSIHAPNSISS